MAQSTVSATYCALKLQQTLGELAAGIYPAYTETETFDTLRAVHDATMLSPNSVEKSFEARPTATSNSEWRVKYIKPDCGAASTTAIDFCADAKPAASRETYGYDKATVMLNVNHAFTIDAKDFQDEEENPMEELAAKLRFTLRKLRKQLNDDLVPLLYASAGNYYANAGDTPVASQGVTAKNLNLFTGNSPTEPQPMGFFDLINEYERMGVGSERTFVLGGGSKFAAYAYAQNIFRGNVDGFDASKGLQVGAYVDYRLDPIINDGNEHVISFHPNAVRLLEWFEFDAPFMSLPDGGRLYEPAQASGLIYRSVVDLAAMINSEDRMPFLCDMEVYYDERCNAVTFSFQKYWDFWYIPQDAFDTACNQHHNYILNWNVGGNNVAYGDLP